jgi:hypothetical protein
VTEFVRDKSIAKYFVISKGSKQTFSVEHVRSSLTLPKPLKVNLRQKFGEEMPFLPFVTFKNGASSTEIEIDTFRLYIGSFILILESFDSNDVLQPTLITDIVTIYVTEYVRDVPVESSIAIMTGNLVTFSMTHVHSLFPLPADPFVDLR